MYVKEELVMRAREADLYDFLLDNYPDLVVREGANTLRHIDHSSLKIFKGYGKGSYRFSMGEGNNSIDFLMRYVDDYMPGTSARFQRAVLDLLPYSPELDELEDDGRYFSNDFYVTHTKATSIADKVAISKKEAENAHDEFILPNKAKGRYYRVFAYLTKTRGLPQDAVERLFHEKLLYEDERGNCVFVSSHCNYAEVRGTNTFGKKFRQSIGKIYNGGYWAFNAKPTNTMVFICEAAIDAISLYCLLGVEDATYVSVGGCTKHESVYNVVHDNTLGNGRYVIAFDSDEPGNKAYERLVGELAMLERITPRMKDWNEDLLELGYPFNNKTITSSEIHIDIPEISWHQLPSGVYIYEGNTGLSAAWQKEEITLSPEIIQLFIEFCKEYSSRFNNFFDVYDLHNMFVDKFKIDLTYGDSTMLIEIADAVNKKIA